MFDNPPVTPEEERELAQIPPDARGTFYNVIVFDLYSKAAVGTGVGWAIGYVVFQFSQPWWYALVLLLMAYFVHRLKYSRPTHYGALAKAKLAMSPDWPEWERDSDYEEELATIRRKNPARNQDSVEQESW